MKVWASIKQFFINLFTITPKEATTMSEDVTDTPTPAPPTATATPVVPATVTDTPAPAAPDVLIPLTLSIPAADLTVTTEIDLNVVRDVLVAMGHDVKEVWEDVVALAKKAV